MKKFLLFIVLCHFSTFWGQTKLSSHFLDLKNPKDKQNIFNAVNPANKNVFIFATDKEKTTLLRYNSALFFADSLIDNQNTFKDKFIAGCDFDQNGNPNAYWASEDFKQITAVNYNFQTKRTLQRSLVIPFLEDVLLHDFTENNTFYLLSFLENQKKLKLYVLKNSAIEEKILDFSGFNFVNERNKPATLKSILEAYPIEKIAPKVFNPLYAAAQKIKLYVENNQMILTFDHNLKETQVFVIDLNSFVINETKFSQTELKAAAQTSNSFLFKDKLFQLKMNKTQMHLAIKALDSGTILKEFAAAENDTINFKNSPLLTQVGKQREKQIATIKKFLRKIDGSDAGISVYQFKKELLLTVGAVRMVTTTGNAILGTTLGIGSAIAGGDALLFNDLFTPNNLESTYFESRLNTQLQPTFSEQEWLAVDKIARFMGDNETLTLENVFKYNNFYILGYYDAKAKQYIMRKFEDGSTNF